MAKESEVEKVKDIIEDEVAQYEKSLENSTYTVGEFIATTDAQEQSDQVVKALGESLGGRLEAAAKKLNTTPEKLAKKVITQYLDSIEKEEKSK